jgi:hypothetical protein
MLIFLALNLRLSAARRLRASFLGRALKKPSIAGRLGRRLLTIVRFVTPL